MSEIILDPICLLGISTYHEKNLPLGLGASIGILYAVNKQLIYKISMSQPLGTHQDSAAQIISRLSEYEILKNRKSKNNINFYDQYTLIGWYFMGNIQNYFDTNKNKYEKISQSFLQRGAPYCLRIDNKGQATLFKYGNKIKFSAKMDTLQRYCSDTMYFQSSKNESTLLKTLRKEKNIIQLYNSKLKQLQKLLKTCNNEKKREIIQLLNTYERTEYFNIEKKVQLNKNLNFSLLNSMILDDKKRKNQ